MASSRWHTLARRARARMGFCLRFGLAVTAMALAFDRWEADVGPLYLYPVSWASGTALDAVGIDAVLDAGGLAAGLCVLRMERAVFHVTYECTGISALVIFLAAVLAHPTTGAHRLAGALAGAGALFVYSVVRLVVLGAIAALSPGHTQFFHVYLLVLMNVGFMLFLWAWWARRAAAVASRSDG